MTTESDIISDLADHLDEQFDYEIEEEEHGVVVHGDFEMFGAPEVKGEVSTFFARRAPAVSGYSVGVTAPPGSLTGPMVIDQIQVVPNA